MWGLLCFELPEQTGMLFLCLEAEHTYPAHTIAAGALLTEYKGSSERGEIQLRSLPASNYSPLIIFSCFRATLEQFGTACPAWLSFLL